MLVHFLADNEIKMQPAFCLIRAGTGKDQDTHFLTSDLLNFLWVRNALKETPVSTCCILGAGLGISSGLHQEELFAPPPFSRVPVAPRRSKGSQLAARRGPTAGCSPTHQPLPWQGNTTSWLFSGLLAVKPTKVSAAFVIYYLFFIFDFNETLPSCLTLHSVEVAVGTSVSLKTNHAWKLWDSERTFHCTHGSSWFLLSSHQVVIGCAKEKEEKEDYILVESAVMCHWKSHLQVRQLEEVLYAKVSLQFACTAA